MVPEVLTFCQSSRWNRNDLIWMCKPSHRPIQSHLLSYIPAWRSNGTRTGEICAAMTFLSSPELHRAVSPTFGNTWRSLQLLSCPTHPLTLKTHSCWSRPDNKPSWNVHYNNISSPFWFFIGFKWCFCTISILFSIRTEQEPQEKLKYSMTRNGHTSEAAFMSFNTNFSEWHASNKDLIKWLLNARSL